MKSNYNTGMEKGKPEYSATQLYQAVITMPRMSMFYITKVHKYSYFYISSSQFYLELEGFLGLVFFHYFAMLVLKIHTQAATKYSLE